MNESVLVLSATKYDFTDDKTGRVLKGLTVWLMPLNQAKNENDNGTKPVKYSLPVEKMHAFDGVSLPAYANMSFSFDFARAKLIPDAFTSFVEFEVGEMV